MLARPIHAQGTLQKIDSSWHIILDNDHPSFEEHMKITLILWDSRSEGSRSEVEEIARVQQLAPEIVALALGSEGKLNNSDFWERFSFHDDKY
jgi:hypothetical protein